MRISLFSLIIMPRSASVFIIGIREHKSRFNKENKMNKCCFLFLTRRLMWCFLFLIELHTKCFKSLRLNQRHGKSRHGILCHYNSVQITSTGRNPNMQASSVAHRYVMLRTLNFWELKVRRNAQWVAHIWRWSISVDCRNTRYVTPLTPAAF
jgi:hypothetical protein